MLQKLFDYDQIEISFQNHFLLSNYETLTIGKIINPLKVLFPNLLYYLVPRFSYYERPRKRE